MSAGAYARRSAAGRGTAAVVMVSGLLALTACSTADAPSAVCDGSPVMASPATVEPGGSFTVTGKRFARCDDMRSGEPQPPYTGVVVRLRQDGKTWDLAHDVAINADGRLSSPRRVVAPSDLSTGKADIDLLHEGESLSPYGTIVVGPSRSTQPTPPSPR